MFQLEAGYSTKELNIGLARARSLLSTSGEERIAEFTGAHPDEYVEPLAEDVLLALANAPTEDDKAIVLLELQRKHNPWKYVHAVHTGYLCQRIGALLGIDDPEELYSLAIGGNVHDAGITAISNRIWNDLGEHSPQQVRARRLHPEFGAIEAGIANLSAGPTDQILGHHEKTDGSGYPYGLMGNNISTRSQITQVADISQALWGRPYDPRQKTVMDVGFIMCKEVLGKTASRELKRPFLRLLTDNYGIESNRGIYWHPLLKSIFDYSDLPSPQQVLEFNRNSALLLSHHPEENLGYLSQLTISG